MTHARDLAEAVRGLAEQLFESFRLTELAKQDVHIDDLTLFDSSRTDAVNTLRGWIEETLATVARERRSITQLSGDTLATPVAELDLPPGALQGTVVRITDAFTIVVAGSNGDRRSYYLDGSVQGARGGETQVWVVPTGTRSGARADARFVCRVGKEPQKPITGDRQPRSAGPARPTGQRPAVRQ